MITKVYSIMAALVLSVVLFASVSYAQEESHSVGAAPGMTAISAKNSVFLELGGNAVVWSVNYDRLLADNIALRIGFGSIGGTATASADTVGASASENVSFSITTVPITISYLMGQHNSKFELGLGAVYAKVGGSFMGNSYSGDGVGATAIVGYRFQPTDGGLFFRAAFTPIILQSTFIPFAGLAFGYSF